MSHKPAPVRRTVKGPGTNVGKWRLPPGAGASSRFSFDSPVAPTDTPGPHCKVLDPKRKGGPRKNCPVQLIFKGGRPYMRLCTAYKSPGKLVPLPLDGVKANEIAQRVCAHWAAGDKAFERWAEHEGIAGLRRRR